MKKRMLCLIIAATAAGAYCNDWPVWRGPDRNGISKETGWNPKGAKKLWTKELGAGYSSVSVRDGRLYTAGHESGDDKTGKDTVYCLAAATGAEIWRYSYPCAAGQYKGPRATPVVDGSSVYMVSQQGLVTCLDAESGKVNWKVDVLEKTGNANIKWGVSSSAVIEGDLLLLNIGEAGVALKKETGAVAWKSKGAFSYASPVVFDHQGKRVAAIFSAASLQVVDVETGKKIDSFEWKTSYDVNGADPVIIGDRIFISSGYDHGCALLDFSSGRLKKVWETDVLKNHFSSSVHMDGYIYGVDGQTKKDGFLRCISAADGSERWSAPIGFGSLIAAGDKLIVLDEAGGLHIAEASPEKYKVISTVATGLEKLCWTPPALADGMIYCRNDKGTLVAIDVSK
jgi:outer membrane protein assembly factor BamB